MGDHRRRCLCRCQGTQGDLMNFEMATAIFSGAAVIALAWVMHTVHALSIDVAVIKQTLDNSPAVERTKKHGKVKLASQ